MQNLHHRPRRSTLGKLRRRPSAVSGFGTADIAWGDRLGKDGGVKARIKGSEMKKKTKRAVQSIIVAGAFATAFASLAAARDKEQSSSSARQSTAGVSGLQAPGKIVVDVWGIP